MGRALPPGGLFLSIEINAKHAALAVRNIDRAGLSWVVMVRVGDAQDVLAELEKEGVPPFDRYFRHALKLTGVGSLFIADNVVRQGEAIHARSNDENVVGAR